jgi:hypothetical protein
MPPRDSRRSHFLPMRILISCIATALLALLAVRAEAARQVRVYEAVVTQSDPNLVAQDAMRVVLVRATGARDAARDPALANLLAQAQQYVLSTRPAARGGGTEVFFDGAAVERDVLSAGRMVWATERPLLVIVLAGGPAAGAFETRRRVEGTLDDTANRRAIPIRVMRPEVLGLPVTPLDIAPEAALTAAQRQGAEAVMIGNGDAVTSGGPWRWTLQTANSNESFVGSLEEGIHAATDVLAREAATVAALPELAVLVEVMGVPGLREYARVAEYFSAAPGVRSVQLSEAVNSTAMYAVVARGGADSLLNALAGNAHFERADPTGGGTIAFRFRP